MIEGSAAIDDFLYYKVEFGAGEQPTSWSIIGDLGYSPIIDGMLTTWYAADLPAGVYTLRLVVVDNTGNHLPPAQVQVNLQH
jgi:hypothetical protein